MATTWTAKKVNPREVSGRFAVDVEIYKNGDLVKTETFETTQDQPSDWPAEGVKQIIRSLRDVPALPAKITEGDVVLPGDRVVDAAAVAWQTDHALARTAKELVDLGVIPANNAKYVALLARLKTNFRAEYIGLI
jgi:hypothetical protein